MNSALGGSGLPSTSETRLPSPLAVRSAMPIHQSVSESAVERGHRSDNAFRLIVIGDHPLALAQVSILLLLLGSRTRIQGYCIAAHISRAQHYPTQTGNNSSR